MFTSLSLKNSRKVKTSEEKKLHGLLEAYCRTDDGRWLKRMGYRGFMLKWCDEMTVESGIMGAFTPWVKNTIFLMPSDCPLIDETRDPWPELIASTLIHELRHAWQFKKYKVLYIICCLPFLRQITLEKDAWIITETAEKFLTEFNANIAAKRFKIREYDENRKTL